MEQSNEFPTLGILGAGQLARMTALAAIRMGISVRFLSPNPEGTVVGLGEHIIGDWEDPEVLKSFAAGCDVVTLESEWAPGGLLEDVLASDELSAPTVWPSSETVNAIRDKGIQKTKFHSAGLPTADFAICKTEAEAEVKCTKFSYPVMAKKRCGSYDGYGNFTIKTAEDVAEAWTKLAAKDGLLIEKWVPFKAEISVLVARTPAGKSVVYPAAWTEQKDHRCHAVVVPAPNLSEKLRKEAQGIAQEAVSVFNGVGLIAVEMFLTEDDKILINELAPRPHNTGHYSIEACFTSQFENHVRAVFNWPLGDPNLQVPAAVMINILGHRSGKPQFTGYEQALKMGNAKIHIYGKSEVRPSRKMGHLTMTGSDTTTLFAQAEKAAAAIQL